MALRKISFTKMQGAGNDYVYINAFAERIEDAARMARRMSDRHFGVGSDGLILIMPSEKADFRMRMFNADGTEAEMCGNASRCVGKYVYDHGLTQKKELTLETGAGIKQLRLYTDNRDLVKKVTVRMGRPELRAQAIPVLSKNERVINEPISISGCTRLMTCVSMGNPHAVFFVEDTDAVEIQTEGPACELHSRFPRRVNTEFVQVVTPTHIKMRVWERGAGETMACGTGACAALVASVLNGLTARQATVELSGGSLEIAWDIDTDEVSMTGPAVTVFEGTFEWEE